jgi:hypothetical protein
MMPTPSDIADEMMRRANARLDRRACEAWARAMLASGRVVERDGLWVLCLDGHADSGTLGSILDRLEGK